MTNSYCATQVRRYDYDRYLTALFAPAGRRESLLALYAFNHEVAKTRETVTEPMIGQMRLQWWRETIDGIYGGNVRQHAVATALAKAIEAHGLPRGPFERLIDAREFDLAAGPPDDVAALLRYAEGTSSTLVALALDIVQDRKGEGWDIAHPGGIAYALTGLLRSLPFHLAQRRCHIPRELLDRHGVSEAALYGGAPEVSPIVSDLAAVARTNLNEAKAAARGAPRAARAALLPLSLAETMLNRLEKRGFDVFDPTIEPAPLSRLVRLLVASRRRGL